MLDNLPMAELNGHNWESPCLPTKKKKKQATKAMYSEYGDRLSAMLSIFLAVLRIKTDGTVT